MKNLNQVNKTILCDNVNDVLEYYTENLGYRIESIFPADNPREVIVFKGDTRIQLIKEEKIEIETTPPAAQSFVSTELNNKSPWIAGRAGMLYKDLIPDRQSGRLIASHIKIPDGGPVADYVHFHKIRFQMIYIYKGWVKLVYEDQGPPFIMNEGDCVLQPPEIRHQVLECSAGFEAIEISSPAEHITYVDYELTLPTSTLNADRNFNEQSFHLHKENIARWAPWYIDGFEYRDVGLTSPTAGLISVHVGRINSQEEKQLYNQNDNLLFMFVLQGDCILNCNGQENLNTASAVIIPANTNYNLKNCSEKFEVLSVLFYPELFSAK